MNIILSWLKNIKLFISLFIIFIIIISILLVLASRVIDNLSLENNNFKNKITQLEQELGKANTTYIKDKKLKEITIKELNKELQKQIKKNKELIIAYGDLEAKYNSRPVITKVKTKIIDQNNEIKTGDLFINGKKVISLPWNYKDFRITINGDIITKYMQYKLHQKFRGQLTETMDRNDNRQLYLNLFELDDKNKIVDKIKIENFSIFRSNNQSHMMWWNPKIDIGTGLVLSSKLKFGYTLDIGTTLFAHGRTKKDLKWRFARIGFGIMNKNFSINFNPVLYNIGDKLSIVSNFYVGPQIGYNFNDNSIFSGIGISVSF